MLVCDLLNDGRIIDRAFYKSGTLHIVLTDAVRLVSETDTEITVTADSYVHIVELDGEFVFDDNYFSLLPGEKRTVSFRPSFENMGSTLEVSGYALEMCCDIAYG